MCRRLVGWVSKACRGVWVSKACRVRVSKACRVCGCQSLVGFVACRVCIGVEGL